MATWNVGYNAAGTALDFTTIASALASASVVNGDKIVLWYSNSTRNTQWSTAHTVSKNLTITGGLTGRVIGLMHIVGTQLTITGTVTISNLWFSMPGVAGSPVVASVYVTTGACVVESCLFIGCSGAAFLNGNGSLQCKNCMLLFCSTGFRSSLSSSGTVTLLNCTSYGTANAFVRSAGTVISKNCAATSYQVACFNGTFDASSTNNASIDGTAPGSNPVDLRTSDAKFLINEANTFPISPKYAVDARVKTGSALLGAGTDVSLTEDIDGNPVSGSFPIGCSNGIATVVANEVLTTATPAGNYVPPSVGDVRPVTFGVSQTGTLANLDGTESAYAALEAARNTDPGEANVKLSTSYKIQNVSKTGTYNPLPAAMPEPAITAVAPGDESLVVSVEPSTGNESEPIYLRFFIAPGGSLSAESATFSRTGEGDVTITGLVNGTVYGVIAYHKSTCPGYASAPGYGMPDADLTDSSTISEVADAVKVELESITFSYPVTYSREWLPRKETKGMDSSTIYATVCPRGSEPVVLSRSRSMKEYQIDIALQCKIDPESNTAVDPMVRLADQIAKSLRNVPLAGAPDARWSREQRQPIFSDGHAEEFSIFTSVITVYYRLDE